MYADRTNDYATPLHLMQLHHYRFRPKAIPTLAAMMALPVLIAFGQWQSSKAEKKQALQDTYDARTAQQVVRVTPEIVDAEIFRYKKVIVQGRYNAAHQILQDNRVHNEQAGYHVITPFQIENSNHYVLVNRGWIPLGRGRTELPQIDTPTETQEITGIAVTPPSKIYELKAPEPLNKNWQVVWQNIDLKRYSDAAPFQVQPIIIQLDEAVPGGFVREWPRPDNRIQTHLGYAFQWYGMAVMLAIFYIATSFKKTGNNNHE